MFNIENSANKIKIFLKNNDIVFTNLNHDYKNNKYLEKKMHTICKYVLRECEFRCNTFTFK